MSALVWDERQEAESRFWIELSNSEFAEFSRQHLDRCSLMVLAVVACRRGDLALLKMCVAKDRRVLHGTATPLQVPLLSFAIMFEQASVAMFLVQQGCSLSQRDLWGRTPLSFAPPDFPTPTPSPS